MLHGEIHRIIEDNARIFPDGNGALMLVCARIRYVTANEWVEGKVLFAIA